MKDVVKSNGYKSEIKIINGKKIRVNRKRRRNNMSGYYALAVIFAAVIILILCVTCFFNYTTETVRINGVTLYSDEQIRVVGGVPNKGNLIRTNTDKIESRLKEHLVYVDDVSVKKKYPSSLEINVTEAKKAADILCDGKYYVLSTSGVILESANDKRSSGVPVIKGVELKSKNPGDKLEATDVMKTKIINKLIETTTELGFKDLTLIDLSDRTNITLNYDTRINIYIGSSVDMDYKLKYIKAVIDERLSDSYRGTLRYNGVNSGISAIPENSKKAKTTAKAAETTQAAEEQVVEETPQEQQTQEQWTDQQAAEQPQEQWGDAQTYEQAPQELWTYDQQAYGNEYADYAEGA